VRGLQGTAEEGARLSVSVEECHGSVLVPG